VKKMVEVKFIIETDTMRKPIKTIVIIQQMLLNWCGSVKLEAHKDIMKKINKEMENG